MAGVRILVIRLGAMGDVIHTLPSVATLKHSFPHCHLSWAVESKWAPLLEGNPFVDRVVPLERGSFAGLWSSARRLRAERFDLAVDFQGLIKSALVASVARADRIYGFHQSQLRERLAGLFYSNDTLARSAHIVDRNLELAAAAGAHTILHAFPLPPGNPEGTLPQDGFVLACPLAGWPAKQWPLENYTELARGLRRDLGLTLVLNGPPQAASLLENVPETLRHVSGVSGLIDATRRATAVVGIDSGPLHLAAALGQAGVAIYGPTDPARNGPYGGTIQVLRSPGALVTYKRRAQVDASMREISPDTVLEALKSEIAKRIRSASCSA